MKKLGIAILLIISAFTSSVFAQMEVNVKSDLSCAKIIFGGSVIADVTMTDGVAIWEGTMEQAKEGKSFGAVVLQEKLTEVVENLSPLRPVLVQKPSMSGGVILSNTAGVYVIVAGKTQWEIYPVVFSALGVGVSAVDGSRWNIGAVHYSEDWVEWNKKDPVLGLLEDRPPNPKIVLPYPESSY